MKVRLDQIKDTVPRRDHGDISDLKKSIQECGLINPLTINQNYRLLAGRRRYQAVKELGWQEVDVRILNSKNDLFDFKVAIEENLKRKSLTDVETAIMIKEYDEMARRLEGERLRGGKGGVRYTVANGIGWTQDRTAEDLGISRQAVTKAIQIAKIIEEIPELAGLKSGEQILNEYKKRKLQEEIKEKAKKFKEEDSIQVWQGDCLELIDNIEDNSIDLLITDPPYNIRKDVEWDKIGTREEYLEWFEKWFRLLIPKYKEKFNAFIFCDPDYFADLELIIRRYYPIKSRIIWHYSNLVKGRVVKDRFISTYQVIFHFGTNNLNFQDEWTEERFDVQKFPAPQTNYGDKKLHQTQKPLDLIKRLVSLGSLPNDLVVDIFAGSGTTGGACKKLKRRCILIEKEPEYCNIIKARLEMIGRKRIDSKTISYA